MLLRGILYILFFPGYGIFFLLQPVYKRPEGEIPVFVYKMDFCRRHTDGAGAPLRHILGRKKLAENAQRIQDNQKHHTDHSQLMLSEFPPHQLPLGFHISGFFRRSAGHFWFFMPFSPPPLLQANSRIHYHQQDIRNKHTYNRNHCQEQDTSSSQIHVLRQKRVIEQ